MGLGTLQYFQSPAMTESSIKKGQYITVERVFFPFFIQKLKRSKYITLFTYCASCLEITEKEHTDKHSNQRNAPVITLRDLIVSIMRIGIQISFNINLTSTWLTTEVKLLHGKGVLNSNQGFASS